MKEMMINGTTLLVTLLLLFVWVLPVRANGVTPTPGPTGSPPADQPADATVEEVAVEPQLVPPVINVWYEGQLKFGHLGNPQEFINIIGNVSDPDGFKSLAYRLDNGPQITLDLGPDGSRLERAGDFNVSIPTAGLTGGTHSVELIATDQNNSQVKKTVTFHYTPGKTWPLPYSTNWAAAGSIYNQAQVVDGLWQINGNTVRPVQTGYDRLIAIGDVAWSDYEVLVPITVHSFPAGTTVGGVGIIARWNGHYFRDQGQLPDGWEELGAYAYWSNREDKLLLRFNGTTIHSQSYPFVLGTNYMFKLRVESTSNGGRYSFKVWKAGDPEPAYSAPQFSNLYNKVDTSGDLTNGSVLLVAHHVDASFGNVTITPLNQVNPNHKVYMPTIIR